MPVDLIKQKAAAVQTQAAPVFCTITCWIFDGRTRVPPHTQKCWPAYKENDASRMNIHVFALRRRLFSALDRRPNSTSFSCFFLFPRGKIGCASKERPNWAISLFYCYTHPSPSKAPRKNEFISATRSLSCEFHYRASFRRRAQSETPTAHL